MGASTTALRYCPFRSTAPSVDHPVAGLHAAQDRHG